MSQLREYIEKHPQQTQRLVGFDYDQLMRLISHAEMLHNQQKKRRDRDKIRIIKAGGGRPPLLAIDEQMQADFSIPAPSTDISNAGSAIWNQ